MTRRDHRGSILFGWGIAGLIAGHTLEYLLLQPNGARRAALLARTGHTYLQPALHSSLLAAAALLALTFARALGRRTAHSRIAPLALSLGMIQTSMFLSVETLERVIARAPLHPLLLVAAI